MTTNRKFRDRIDRLQLNFEWVRACRSITVTACYIDAPHLKAVLCVDAEWVNAELIGIAMDRAIVHLEHLQQAAGHADPQEGER